MNNGRELLIVDGDPAYSSALAQTFRRKSYGVQLAHSSRAALRTAANGTPDHFVVDLKLPDGSGLELIKNLKTAIHECKIVVVTSYASIATAVEAIKLGAIHYLPKPVHPDDVVSAFERNGGDASLPVVSRAFSVDRLVWEYINQVLVENGGNISASARALSMHRRTLQRMLRKQPAERRQETPG